MNLQNSGAGQGSCVRGVGSVILTCFVLFCFVLFLIAKQLAILKILNNLKHATDRLQLPSSPQVVK
jgi:hypothetical protein